MIERLTARELEILELAAQHLTSKQIGPRLGIRPASVDTFMQTIIRKLEVGGRKQAIILYLAGQHALGSSPGEGRGNLDSGSPTVDGFEALSFPGLVAGRGQREASNTLGLRAKDDQGASEATGAQTETQVTPADRASERPAAPPFLASVPRRLVAVAVVTLLLGFVTFGAITAGYELTQTFDRVFRDHVSHP